MLERACERKQNRHCATREFAFSFFPEEGYRPRNDFHAWANEGSFPDVLALSSTKFTSLRLRSDSRVIANQSGARVSTPREEKKLVPRRWKTGERERERKVRVGALIDNPTADVWARLNATSQRRFPTLEDITGYTHRVYISAQLEEKVETLVMCSFSYFDCSHKTVGT